MVPDFGDGDPPLTRNSCTPDVHALTPRCIKPCHKCRHLQLLTFKNVSMSVNTYKARTENAQEIVNIYVICIYIYV